MFKIEVNGTECKVKFSGGVDDMSLETLHMYKALIGFLYNKFKSISDVKSIVSLYPSVESIIETMCEEEWNVIVLRS